MRKEASLVDSGGSLELILSPGLVITEMLLNDCLVLSPLLRSKMGS